MDKRIIDYIRREWRLPETMTDQQIGEIIEGSWTGARLAVRYAWDDLLEAIKTAITGE